MGEQEERARMVAEANRLQVRLDELGVQTDLRSRLEAAERERNLARRFQEERDDALARLSRLEEAVRYYVDSGIEAEHPLYGSTTCPHCQAFDELRAALSPSREAS